MRSAYLLLLAASLASACARAHAKTTPDSPPLEVPAPPPREVEATEVEPPPPVSLVPEPARTPVPSRARPASPPARTEPPKTDPPKPETVEPPKPAEEAPRPPTTLQTRPTTAEGEVERSVRATLARATSELNHIDYRGLNQDARTQYDTAKRFIRQADEAVKAKNLVYAKNLADKAAVIAAQLAGR